MSKWINKKLFESYVAEKEKEVSEKPNFMKRSDFVWQSPTAGTVDKPKVYEGRLLPDPKSKFTMKYHYHMWKSGDKWMFYLCPKTYGMDKFCPICSVVSSLYSGTADDKKTAFKMKRKERYVSNFYIVSDPRDKEIDDDNKKSSGKVKLYEFPAKLESKIKNETLDKKEGLGDAIFDPGDEGHNIIIKIKSTKPNERGETFPDYSDSTFSRKSYPLRDTDKEISDIMASTYSLDEYIKGMEMSKDDTIKMLKNEMLWEMVESDWARNFGDVDKKEEPKKVVAKEESKAKEPEKKKEADDVPAEIGDDTELLDELKELL